MKANSYVVLLGALFVSGASGLINQIGWQRAVKVYLANSETLSAMIVVLVFMLGLGLGSAAAAVHSARLRNPFRTLGLVEVALCAVNGVLIVVFGDGLRRQGHALQAAALEAGISSTVTSALLSFAVLIVPCFLMGLTIPIAAEAAQRQLEIERKKAVSDFFVLNTIGAVLGTLGCGLILLPMFGQKVALGVAAAGNLLAGLVILGLLSRRAVSERVELDAAPRESLLRRKLQTEELLAFVLGALSLSYEIYLFRIVALAYTPLPWVFAVVLCLFLLFWSLGMMFSERVQVRLSTSFLIASASIAVVPFVLEYHRFYARELTLWSAGLVYFVPCFGFGLLFGLVITRYARRWGRDVGVFTALNTAGSGVGIVVTTFVLFEIENDLVAWILSLAFLAFVPRFMGGDEPTSRARWASRAAVAAMIGTLVFGLARGGLVKNAHFLAFHGRDGVVEIAPDGRVFIDGLWHSVLYRDEDTAARRNVNVRRKMLIALLPFLAHEGTGPKTALNIGMGTGATARTLAKSPMIASVHAYEIVNTVARVIEAFPAETLGTRDLAKIHVRWEDARAGLVRHEDKYDIITQSPMYLKQAGSSFLLSRQYFELVKSRLKPGGIVGIYCNSQGNPDQAALVRRTVSEVFEHYESFGDGYFILASNRPIALTRENFSAKVVPGDPIADDIRVFGANALLAQFDRPRLDWKSSPYIVTDDHPLVEHPVLTRYLFARAR